MVIEAYKNPDFAKVINSSTYTVADGVPLLKALKLLYGISQERVAGMDFMPRLIAEAEKNDLSVFFYGSSNDVLSKIQEKIKKEHPTLKIAGMFSPPFRPLSDVENKNITDNINQSGANIVFVGLGCPKQEMWMARNSAKINAVLLGVGAAFNTYSGTMKMAPQWMRDNSIEWIYRLFQEPRRLFKRYFITNTLFILLIFRQLLKVKLNL